MKYIVNEDNTCGQASLSDENRNALLEALGFPPNAEEEVVEEGTAGAAPRGPYKNIGQDAQDKLEERGKKGKKDDDNGDPRAFGGKKGDKSKTRKGKDFEKNGDDDENGDDNGDFRAFGRKKGDKSKTHKGRDFEKESQEADDNPSLYEWDDAVFSLDDEVFEIEGSYFLKAQELDGETKHSLDESHADLFVNVVEFDEGDYTLGDIYDFGKDIYIKMDVAIEVEEN